MNMTMLKTAEAVEFFAKETSVTKVLENNNIKTAGKNNNVNNNNFHEESHFFEGAEKLLEIWFYDDVNEEDEALARQLGDNNMEIAVGRGHSTINGSTLPQKSLRNIPRDELEKMLEVARCRILHSKSNEYIDSYVLSESSMFVSDSRFILKTCGKTDLLGAVPLLLELASKYANMRAATNVYYSRKNFLRPNLQPHTHKCFNKEVDNLDVHFKEGNAYCMGSLKDDRWYLYTTSNPQAPPICADHGLEILMSDLPADVLNVYSTAQCASGKDCTRKAGMLQLVPPGTMIHEELFDPVGYSMNGLVADSDQYVTVHVTPESDFSYASFETNQRRECLYKQTLKVLDCFRPNRIILIVFSNNLSANGKETQTRIWQNELPGYRRINLQFLRLQYDTLVYAQFARIAGAVSNHHKIRRLIDNDEDDSNHDSD